jgi:parvulin-like peptidyl-prolyl isomerase
MAKELAQKVYEDAKSGREDFLTLAARHSDDTEKLSNGGDMRYVSPAGLVEPVRKQIASMSRKGEVAPPVESHQGFHIIRFIDRRAPQLAKFEDVKRGIIAAEREALQKKQREEAIAAVRGSSTVVVHRANVEAMVVPIDDVLRKAAAGEKAAESAPKK